MNRDEVRLANEAWEALFRAQVVLMRAFTADDTWQELSITEYDVLYTLSKAEDGLHLVDIERQVLLTQGGVSRLVSRLEARGFLARRPDPRDRRAARIVLTPLGRKVQRAVGRRHAHAVAAAMTSALDVGQLAQLRDLARRIIAGTDPHENPDHPRTKRVSP